MKNHSRENKAKTANKLGGRKIRKDGHRNRGVAIIEQDSHQRNIARGHSHSPPAQ